MSRNMKIKIFKGVTQIVGCFTILYDTCKLIYYVLTNYWPVVVISYLVIAEAFVFSYTGWQFYLIVRKQLDNQKRY